jgi:predicted CoA-substrate-specific enzyme activase
MGIDVGSTTAKAVVLDGGGLVRFADYRRHHAAVVSTVAAMLDGARDCLGDAVVDLAVTGSAGLGLSERLRLPHVQEVVAAAGYVRTLYPDVRTLVDVGGEDAKIVFFRPGEPPDIRMNGSCAGGTGAYIDEMAGLLSISVEQLDALAGEGAAIHTIASRCGVFAKTDVQNLLSREAPRPEIAASIFHSVVLQVLSTLARGSAVEPAVLLCGGPFTFLPALRQALARILRLSDAGLVLPERAELLPALGAALTDDVTRVRTRLGTMSRRLSASAFVGSTAPRLPPLFRDDEEFERWSECRTERRIERVAAGAAAGGRLFLGVDSGSTTTKLVLVDEAGRIAYERYAPNRGDPIGAVRDGLIDMRRRVEEGDGALEVTRSIATGYGEELIRAAFDLDDGMVETLAHYRAAVAFDPQVSFILDIGGQDMKAVFVRDGHIDNIEINEACSSGCGTFIESFARSLGYDVAALARSACSSRAPCDLGTRCTVFMNSKVKQALREGAPVQDIAAGLAYSVVKNALHKVLRVTDPDVLGEHIVVQGGTFRNPAIQRALELLLGRSVVCPDTAELMGAYGAALTARSQWLASRAGPGGRPTGRWATGPPAAVTGGGRAPAAVAAAERRRMEDRATYEKSTFHCRGCENRCAVSRLRFTATGNVFFTGNRCERITAARRRGTPSGADLLDVRRRLLFDRDGAAPTDGRPVIGIPRALVMYEVYPFFHTLLTQCGLGVRLSRESTTDLYERCAPHVTSENICFPAKLVHGHVLDLVDSGVDRILYPMVFHLQQEFADALNCYTCPIVAGYADVIRSAHGPDHVHGVPFDSPAFAFSDRLLLLRSCWTYIRGLGVSATSIPGAFRRAIAAQAAYSAGLRREGGRVLCRARDAGRRVVLLLCRSYHSDPRVHHRVPELFAGLGVDVITPDAVPIARRQRIENPHVLTNWVHANRHYHAAGWAAEQDGVDVAVLNSFGCGPDAFVIPEVRSVLADRGKPLTVLRIDEIESSGSARLRVRSMVELKEALADA